MLKFKLLTTAFLTMVLGTGVTVGVAANNYTPSVEVDAASTVTLYLDTTGFTDWSSSSASFKVHTWNSAKGDKYHTATQVDNNYWKADVDLATYANGGGYRFTRFNTAGTQEWNRGLWCSYNSSSPSYYFKPSDWTEKGSWTRPLDTTWSLVGGNSADSWATGNFEHKLTDVIFNGSGLQYYKEGIYLEQGTSLKVKSSTNTWLGYNAFETGTGSVITLKDFTGSGTNNLEVKKSGYYDFYFKVLTNKVWAQENSNKSALGWADSFLTDLTCDATGKTAPDTAKWTEFKNSYDALTVGAQAFLKDGKADKNSTDSIEKALAKYDFIVSKYGSTKYADFIGRVSGSSVKLNLILLQENNNYFMIIAIVACGLALSTSLIFVIKRRKQTSK